MPKKRNHHEPYCHNCHADFLQFASVRVTLDTGEPLICHLEPGEDNCFDVIIDGLNVKSFGIVDWNELSIECTECNAYVTKIKFGDVEFDRDIEDLHVPD